MTVNEWVIFIWTIGWMTVGIYIGYTVGDNHEFLRACKRFGDTFKK